MITIWKIKKSIGCQHYASKRARLNFRAVSRTGITLVPHSGAGLLLSARKMTALRPRVSVYTAMTALTATTPSPGSAWERTDVGGKLGVKASTYFL